MPIRTQHLGPGSLILGSGPLAVQGQITNCRVEWTENVTTGTAIPVLSGEELAASERITHTATLAGSLLQDWAAAGVIDWSYTHKGTPQPFVFIPSTEAARQVVGVILPIPITIGGDVTGTADNRGEPARADFTWRCKGEPDFGDV